MILLLVRFVTTLWFAVTASAFSFQTIQGTSPTFPTKTAANPATVDAKMVTTTNLDLAKKNDMDTPTDGAMMIRRRTFLWTSAMAMNWIGFVSRADAKYGAASNMELPNYIEYLVEKNQQQQVDRTAVLYQGADPVVLLQRLQDANQRLQEIPSLAAVKKWSQIQGLLTGPLGTVSQTLNQLMTATAAATTTTTANSQIQQMSKTVKADLIAIGQAASQKNGEACIFLAKKASDDLKSFLELIFDE